MLLSCKVQLFWHHIKSVSFGLYDYSPYFIKLNNYDCCYYHSNVKKYICSSKCIFGHWI